MEKKTTLKVAVSVVLLLIAGGVVYWYFVGRGGSYAEAPNKIWFYDVSTKKLITADVGTPSPMTTPSGGEAFRAYVYSCGDCEGVDESGVVYLERDPKIDPSLPKMIQADRARVGAQIAAPGQLDRWFAETAPPANELKSAIMTMCDGNPAVPCPPRDE